VERPRGRGLGLPQTWLKERIAPHSDFRQPQIVDIDDRDLQTLFEALFDIKDNVEHIRELLEDDDEEEEDNS
jgi:hypothetical protein